jgi:hydroxymethylpyrimidine pyrophosphatase-like HAD family hydrolase
VPCTGRAWHESHFVLRDLPGLDLGVFITGACVARVDDGASVDLALIEPHLAMRIVEVLRDEPEAVLAFRESALAGHHYLVTGHGELTENTRWWFEVTGAEVHFQRHVTPRDLHHTLRVGMVAASDRIRRLERKVAQALGDRVQVHSFAALKREDEAHSVSVLEVFAAEAHKWRGLTWVAEQRGVEPHEIATIGDEVNDVAMLKSAGCGIAMGNAAEPARKAAKRTTLPNTEHGVAHAIDQILRGAW